MQRVPMDDADRMVAMLERARQIRGISVAELSRRIGVDRKRLWRVLNGQRAMRVDEFVKLCAFFGVGIGALAPARQVKSAGRDPFP